MMYKIIGTKDEMASWTGTEHYLVTDNRGRVMLVNSRVRMYPVLALLEGTTNYQEVQVKREGGKIFTRGYYDWRWKKLKQHA